MRLGKVAVCAALVLVAFTSLASAQPARRRAVIGQILVTFAPDTNANEKADAHRSARGRLMNEVTGRGVALVAVPAGDEDAAVARYRGNPHVRSAEPNYIRHVPEPVAHGTDAPLVPRDKLFGQQWGFHNTGQEFYCIEWILGNLCLYQGTPDADIDAPEAWAITTGSPAVTVAVIDTGIDYRHPDLAAHYAGGYDYVHGTLDPLDDHGHGTHVAGTIAASFENPTGDPATAEGVVGVAPQTRLLAYKVCAADGTCTDFAVIQAISQAVADGAKVINMSLGDTVYSQALADAVQAAWHAGVVIVAGAGNDGTTAPFYPAALDNVVAVGAFDEDHNRASFSNYGSWVDIAAPGSNILSTYPLDQCTAAGVPGDTGCYAWLSGTSMATPHVSGAAALLWSRSDVTSNVQVVDLLLHGADPAGVSNVRLDSWTAHGGLNLHDSLSDGLATGRPVANAGPDQTLKDTDADGSALVALDGSASSDPNGSIVAYEWREGAAVVGTTATLSVAFPIGTHTLALTVTDNDGLTAADTVVIAVEPATLVTVAATTAQAFEAGLQPAVFTVTRNGDTSASLTVQYVVSGTATAGSDYQALPGTVAFAAGAATATITVVPIDDDLTETNETVVVTLTPGTGYGVGAAGTVSVAIVSDDLPPDLIVAASTVPSTGGADVDLVITDTTKNQGTGAASASATGFYLSMNTTLDASDVFVGSRPVPRLVAGTTGVASTPVHIPAGTATGTYFVLVKSDWNNQVPESVETNNVRATNAVRIGPDLAVSAVTAPATGVAGGTISVSDTTVNQGGGAAASTTATFFYLSSNTTLDAADVLLGSRNVPALAAGVPHAGSASLVVPPGTAGGSYYVIASADGGKALAETSETNNSRVTSSIKIGADLVVTALTASADTPLGGVINVTDTTKNQGPAPAPDASTGFYLSANSVLDASDVFLGARPVGPLAANATSIATTPLQVPPGTAAGSYYVVAVADWSRTALESVESNNTRAAAVRIGPDMVVSALTVTASAVAGASLSVSDTTKNQGPEATPATTTRFYLSTSSTVTAAAVLIGSRTVGALAAGTSATATTTLVIPAQTVPGAYFVVAMADGDGTVPESVETNNTRYRNLAVTAP